MADLEVAGAPQRQFQQSRAYREAGFVSGLKLNSVTANVQCPCNSVDYRAGDRATVVECLRILATFLNG